MHEAAERQEFEEAARYRNRLTAVRHLAERQAADKRAIGTVDVVGIASGGRTAAVQIFPLRGGRLVDRHTFYLENEAGEDVPQLLESFCLEYYGGAPSIPPLIVVPPDVGPTDALAGFLSDLRGSRVEVRPSRRGEKRRLQELAQQNAELALESDAANRERKRLRRIEALEELRECLNLESLPIRIECFDISNIQGDSPVGSMVVFQDAVPKKAHYRKFGIKGVEGQDDFAMMAEVVSRRFARAKEVTAERYDEGFAADPEPRRRRRRQGAALGRARRHPGLRPAAGRGHRAGEARGGGLRPGPPRARSCSSATRRGSSSCSGSATRRTASHSASTAGAATQGARVDPRRATRRRPGAQARPDPALRLA